MMSYLNLIAEDKLDSLILDIVESVLTEIFGVEPTRVMLQTMKKRYHLDVQEIPQEPRVFSHALENILGRNHTIIEDLILENLCLKLKVKLKMKEGYTFSDYIMDLRFESL
jgi:hypothetical protein